MPYSYRTREIGRGASPASEHILMVSIAGRALAKGDAADSTQSNSTAQNGGKCGWLHFTVHERQEAVGILPMPPDVPANARVFSAVMHLVGSTTVGASQSFSSSHYLTDPTVEIWPVRRPLAADLAGLTAANYATASAWQERLVKFGVGADTDGAPLAAIEYDAATRDYDVDLRAEFQRCLDFGDPLQIVFRAMWPDPPGSEAAWFNWTNPGGFTAGGGHANALHTWFELFYRRHLEIYGADAAGALDQTDLKDVASAGLEQHLWLGSPPQGSETAATKFFARNELTVSLPAVVIEAGRSRVGPISHRGVAGTGRLRLARPFDAAAGEGTPSGTWRLLFTSATQFTAYFTPDGGDEDEVATAADITGDISVTVDGLDALSIPYYGAGLNWSGTFATGDVIRFETRADLHTSAYPLEDLEGVSLAPHAAGTLAAANTLVARPAELATTQQLCSTDARTIANSGGSVAVIANVTDGGSWTHCKVPDPLAFAAGSWATVANFAAKDETDVSAGTYVEHCYIEAVYDLDDATYPGQLRLAASASGGSLANTAHFDGRSLLTSGVWLGQLAAPDQAFLAAAASTLSPVVTLASPIRATSGTVTLLDPATGETESRTIKAGGVSSDGLTVEFTIAPSFAYPAGSLLFFGTETTSSRPFFLTAAPDVGAETGRRQAFVVADTAAVV